MAAVAIAIAENCLKPIIRRRHWFPVIGAVPIWVGLVQLKDQFSKSIVDFNAFKLGDFWVFARYLPSVVIAIIIGREKIWKP